MIGQNLKYKMNFFKENGWIHIRDVITNKIVFELRNRAIKWRKWVNDKEGTPCQYGPPIHWKGLGCAGMYDEYLMKFYTNKLMYNLASKLLNTKDIWLYNDQIVVKLPNDNFGFTTHTDNESEGTNSVNICVILDDFTDENGTLQIKGTKIYPKAGDIVAIHGDTPHQSEPNKSDKARCLYACVYSSSKINHQRFYNNKFNEPISLNSNLL